MIRFGYRISGPVWHMPNPLMQRPEARASNLTFFTASSSLTIEPVLIGSVNALSAGSTLRLREGPSLEDTSGRLRRTKLSESR